MANIGRGSRDFEFGAPGRGGLGGGSSPGMSFVVREATKAGAAKATNKSASQKAADAPQQGRTPPRPDQQTSESRNRWRTGEQLKEAGNRNAYRDTTDLYPVDAEAALVRSIQRGDTLKEFAKGGSVRGSGCAVRGVKKCKMR